MIYQLVVRARHSGMSCSLLRLFLGVIVVVVKRTVE
jgi:hypothetical protein